MLVFCIDDRRYALHVDAVLRVLPMVDIAPLPTAPGIVVGVIDVAGRIVPVLDMRQRLGFEARASRLSDVLILARTRELRVALPADGVVGVVERTPASMTPAERIAPGIEQVAGVVKLDDGLALIQDLDAFLSLPQRAQLSRALAEREVARR